MQMNQVLLSAIMASSALAVPFTDGRHGLSHAKFHKRAPDAVWVTDWETVVFTEYVTVYGDIAATTSVSTTSSKVRAVKTTSVLSSSMTTSIVPSSATSSSSTSSSDLPTIQLPVQRQISQPASQPTTAPSQAPPSPSVEPPSATPAPATTPATTPAAPVVVDTPQVQTSAAVQAPTSAPAVAVVAQAAASTPAQSSTGTSSSSSSSSGTTFTGDITYYSVGMGSCGVQNNDSEMVVALAKPAMTAAYSGVNPNANPLCGATIIIQGDNGPVTAKIMDTCPGCTGHDLDLSPAVFKAVAPNGDGRVSNVKWSYAS